MKKDLAESSLLKLTKLVLEGYGTQDGAWYQALQELIMTIFLTSTSPEKISHFIIVKMCKPIFVNRNSTSETQNAFMTQNINSAPNFTQNDEENNQMNLDLDNLSGINSNNIYILYNHFF